MVWQACKFEHLFPVDTTRRQELEPAAEGVLAAGWVSLGYLEQSIIHRVEYQDRKIHSLYSAHGWCMVCPPAPW